MFIWTPRSFEVFQVEFAREIYSKQATLKSLAEILPMSSEALHVRAAVLAFKCIIGFTTRSSNGITQLALIFN